VRYTRHAIIDGMAEQTGALRVDRWLWAARFFRTRSLAVAAIEAGHVDVNGARAKPSKEVHPGDQLTVRAAATRWELVVLRTDGRRGPASHAATLYEETEASRERRARVAAERRLAPDPGGTTRGRPTKRDRRRIEELRGRRG
jgi:ribosome-associated heat shock protein Hsp15